MNFWCVYRYPCAVAVSPPLYFLNSSDRHTIAAYICAVVDEAASTMKLLKAAHEQPGYALRTPEGPFSLYAHQVFLKPATPRQFASTCTAADQMSCVSAVLTVFHALDVGRALDHACSPLGMVSVPVEDKETRKEMLEALCYTDGACGEGVLCTRCMLTTVQTCVYR